MGCTTSKEQKDFDDAVARLKEVEAKLEAQRKAPTNVANFVAYADNFLETWIRQGMWEEQAKAQGNLHPAEDSLDMELDKPNGEKIIIPGILLVYALGADRKLVWCLEARTELIPCLVNHQTLAVVPEFRGTTIPPGHKLEDIQLSAIHAAIKATDWQGTYYWARAEGEDVIGVLLDLEGTGLPLPQPTLRWLWSNCYMLRNAYTVNSLRVLAAKMGWMVTEKPHDQPGGELIEVMDIDLSILTVEQVGTTRTLTFVDPAGTQNEATDLADFENIVQKMGYTLEKGPDRLTLTDGLGFRIYTNNESPGGQTRERVIELPIPATVPL